MSDWVQNRPLRNIANGDSWLLKGAAHVRPVLALRGTVCVIEAAAAQQGSQLARVNDRRVISAIVHVLKSGCRWVDTPPDYGPRKTLHNRSVRWAKKRGMATRLHRRGRCRWPAERNAHRQFSRPRAPVRCGRKRGGNARHQAFTRWPNDEDPRNYRPVLSSNPFYSDGRSCA